MTVRTPFRDASETAASKGDSQCPVFSFGIRSASAHEGKEIPVVKCPLQYLRVAGLDNPGSAVEFAVLAPPTTSP